MAAFLGSKRLTLAELLATASRAETDLLTFDFTGIARDETGLAQGRLEGCVIVDQRTGDAVAHCAGLAGLTAAVDVDHDVKRLDVGRQIMIEV